MSPGMRKAILWSVLAALSSGCGYNFQGSGTILPEDVRTVAIVQSQNETTEPGLAIQFTEALRTRFERYGVVKVVQEAGGADAILRSSIKRVGTRVRNTTGATDQLDVEVDLELAFTVSAELKKKNGQILWRDDSKTVYQSFASVGGVVVTQSAQFAGSDQSASQLSSLNTRELSRGQKDRAMNDAMDEAARQIYNEAVAEDF